MAGGTLLNSIDGSVLVWPERQAHIKKHKARKTIVTDAKRREAGHARAHRDLIMRDCTAWNLTEEWRSTIMTGGGSYYRLPPHFANMNAKRCQQFGLVYSLNEYLSYFRDRTTKLLKMGHSAIQSLGMVMR
jgi:hypothetical protein